MPGLPASLATTYTAFHALQLLTVVPSECANVSPLVADTALLVCVLALATITTALAVHIALSTPRLEVLKAPSASRPSSLRLPTRTWPQALLGGGPAVLAHVPHHSQRKPVDALVSHD
jgi:hypothetical protein